MNRCGKIALLVAAVTLSGCQGMKKTNRVTVTPQAGHPVLSAPVPASRADAPAPAGVQKQLSTCLFEAEQLTRLDRNKYREPVVALYHTIRSAQYYATLASRLSTSSTDTLTPMYQYKVNDACNTVSQLLLDALKQGARVAGANP